MKKKAAPEIKVSLSGDEFQFEKRNERGLNLETLIKFDLSVTERELAKNVKRRAEKVAIKGFRKGKAPLSLIGPELSYELGPKVIDALIGKSIEILGESELKDWRVIPRFSVERKYNPFQTEAGESFSFVAHWEKESEKFKFDTKDIAKRELKVLISDDAVKNSVNLLSRYVMGEEGAEGKTKIEEGDVIFCKSASVTVNGNELSDGEIFSLFSCGFNDVPLVSQQGRDGLNVVLLCSSELLSTEGFKALTSVEIAATEEGLPNVEVEYETEILSGKAKLKLSLLEVAVYSAKIVSLEDKIEQLPIVSTLVGPITRFALLSKRCGIWDEESLNSFIDGLTAHAEIGDKLQKLYQPLQDGDYRIRSELEDINTAEIYKGEELLAAETLPAVTYGDLAQAAVYDLKVLAFEGASDCLTNDLCREIKEKLVDEPIGDSKLATLFNDALLLSFANQREDVGYSCLELEREALDKWVGCAKLSELLRSLCDNPDFNVEDAELKERVFSMLRDLDLQRYLEPAKLNERMKSLMFDRNFHRIAISSIMHERAMAEILEQVVDSVKFAPAVSLESLQSRYSLDNHMLDRRQYFEIAFFASSSYSKLMKEENAEHSHEGSDDSCEDPSHNHSHDSVDSESSSVVEDMSAS